MFSICYGGYIGRKVRVIDKYQFTCDYPVYIGGEGAISIHSGHLRKNARISAIVKYGNDSCSPTIRIGKNFNLGMNSHIGCLTSIIIGDNFLSGANCLITDHTHGKGWKDEEGIPPVDRPLFSKGPVVIGNNVFIGENVVILPNVIIGDNVTIGASTVVTKNIPNNMIAVGNPMRLIYKSSNESFITQ